MIKKLFTALLLIYISFGKLQATDCYSEYWQNLFWNMWENDSYGIGTYVKLETNNHLKGIRYLQLNEQFLWKATKNLSLELHYVYLHDKSIIPKSVWRSQHRLELEASYVYKLASYVIDTRNRLEIRRVKGEPLTLFRFRQRTMFIIPIEDKGSLKAFSVYNELFYDLTNHLFTQDRICPFQMTFAVSDKINMDLFFLFRVFEANQNWNKSVVFGTQFSF